MTVQDLEAKAAELFGISDPNRVLLYLRHSPVTPAAQPRLELYNMDYIRAKKLKDVRSQLSQGNMLFVDEGSLKETKFEEMNWYKSIIGNQEILRLKVEDGVSTEPILIKINKGKTLQELKEVIGMKIGIAAENFILTRKHVIREMKEFHLTLGQLGFNNGASLEVKPGKANQQPTYNLSFKLIKVIEEDLAKPFILDESLEAPKPFVE